MSFNEVVNNWCSKLPKNGAFQEFMIDTVFLGSYPVIILCLIFVVIYAYLQKEYIRGMIFTAYSTAIIFLFELIRELTGIPQAPKVIWLTIDEHDRSILLGYSVMSMAMYIIIAQSIRIGQRKFVIGYAIFISILIGVARVIMGVHTATETLISWGAGILIAYFYSWINNQILPPIPILRGKNDEEKLIGPTIIKPPSINRL